MKQTKTISKKEAQAKAIPFTENEIKILSVSNFDSMVDETTYKSIVEEMLIKTGEDEFSYFEENEEEGKIFVGNIEDVTENMDAFY